MQTYDEKLFNEKANIRAGKTWLFLMILVTIYYGAKMAEGAFSSKWFIILCAVGWGEYIFAGITLKMFGYDYKNYKW